MTQGRSFSRGLYALAGTHATPRMSDPLTVSTTKMLKPAKVGQEMMKHQHQQQVPCSELQGLVAQALSKRLDGDSLGDLAMAKALAQELLGCDGDDIHSMVAINHGVNAQAFADALVLYHLFTTSQDAYISSQIHQALRVLSDAFRLYGANGVFTSFNGGKDAVVIMHLCRAALANYCVAKKHISRPRLVFFESDSEFEEIHEFVNESETTWNLELLRLDSGFVKGLQEIVDNEGGVPLGFVLGTRRGDPNAVGQHAFEPSSDWMPPFMRVNPIIEWEYGHIWHFLRLFQLPYCSLYDQGYTSLGKKADSRPNPELRKTANSGESTSSSAYWPAYMLSNWSLERAGRGKIERPDHASAGSRVLSTEIDKDANESKRVDMSRVQRPSSAALVIIGDEILKGKCCDTNGPFAAKELRTKGVPLQRIVTVPDDRASIVNELRACMQQFDLVITSGGLGPTHDDITIVALAEALGQELQHNAEMDAHLRKVYGIEAGSSLSVEAAKTAQLPEFSRLLWPPRPEDEQSEGSEDHTEQWPILKCDNVFVLPGVPQFFEYHLHAIVEHFVEARKLYTFKVVLGMDEGSILSALNAMVIQHPAVNFGSYPFISQGHNLSKTVITLEGSSQKLVDAALEGLIGQLPTDAILRVEHDDTLT